MKKALIKAGFYSGFMGGVLRVRRKTGGRILMYHHILPEMSPFLPGISQNVFSRQIEYLRRRYHLMDLERMAALLAAGKALSPRSLALTFDDGYEDVYNYAFPLLKRLEIPATVFVATGFVDTDFVPWTDELRTLFQRTNQKHLEIKDEAGRGYSWNDEASRLRALERIKGRLKTLPDEERAALYQDVKAQLKVDPAGETRILSRRQIKEMAGAGISFGGHTVHHVILTKVRPETARNEIVQSKAALEDITGRPVRGFCYPNGGEEDFNEEIKGLVRDAGYSYACTTLEGSNSAETDRYELKRLWTSEDSLPLFAAHLLR